MNKKPLLGVEPAPVEVKAVPEPHVPESAEVLRWSDPNRVIERKLDGGDEIVQEIGAIPLNHLARTQAQREQEARMQQAWDNYNPSDQ
jgi:hypothetical protein